MFIRLIIFIWTMSMMGCVYQEIDSMVSCTKTPVELSVIKKVNPTECIKANGEIIVSVKNGTLPITFKLGSQTSDKGIFSDLPSATYQIIATDRIGCADTLTVTLEAPVATNLSWVNQLKPLFTTRCAKSGCHIDSGRGDFSKYSDVKEYLTNIRHRVSVRSMPQDSPLADDQIRLIICWIDAGAAEF